MLGDNLTEPPSVSTAPSPSAPVAPVTAPTYLPPKPKPSFLPLVFGFLLVIILAAVIGVVYYKNQLTTSPSPSPSPLSSPISQPSPDTSSTPSANPKSSNKPSGTPKSTTVVSKPSPLAVVLPTLDLRLGNPSGNFKQTIDEGKGDGRVINREYTSIQAGQFDEVIPNWSPKVTLCFHFVANEAVAGKSIKFTFTLDDKIELEDNLGTYDKLETGKIYDWCHDSTTSIGKHTAKLQLNSDKSLKESNYNNNLARIDWENLADKIAPNFTIDGPYLIDGKTCMRWIHLEDNISVYTDVWAKWKIDGADWSGKTSENPYGCITGTSGSSHTYYVHAEDARGNAYEQSKSFVLY